MIRRIIHVGLLFAGLAPAVWAICIFSSDPRRASVLVALAALGLSLNATALRNRHFGMRLPLRVIACGVALVVFGSVMRMWHWIRRDYLAELPTADIVQRQMALAVADNLVWIAAGVAYVIVTVLVLPKPAKKTAAPTAKEGGRIDFRKLAR